MISIDNETSWIAASHFDAYQFNQYFSFVHLLSDLIHLRFSLIYSRFNMFHRVMQLHLIRLCSACLIDEQRLELEKIYAHLLCSSLFLFRYVNYRPTKQHDVFQLTHFSMISSKSTTHLLFVDESRRSFISWRWSVIGYRKINEKETINWIIPIEKEIRCGKKKKRSVLSMKTKLTLK